jgi:shikimate dehydrogenase
VGKKLAHSWSKSYFEDKFQHLGLANCWYDLFEVNSAQEALDLFTVLPNLEGLNVTIPLKTNLATLIPETDDIVKEIGAVNVIRKINGTLVGYNTDGPAFEASLKHFIPESSGIEVVILGAGGASKAVQWALQKIDIPSIIVSRSSDARINYQTLPEFLQPNHLLYINCTPVGMWPNTEECPNIDYNCIDKGSYLYDLIYNPEKTLFLRRGENNGAKIKNGREMLTRQADLSWDIWNT